MFRARSTTIRSGRSSDDASARSIPRPTSSERSGTMRGVGCGRSIRCQHQLPSHRRCLSFFPGKHLDLESVLKVGGFHGQVRRIGRPGIRGPDRWVSWRLYHPDVTRVQLNVLDSHDTPRFLDMHRRGSCRAFVWPDLPLHLPGRAMLLLRRRDRPGGWKRSGLSTGLCLGPRRRGTEQLLRFHEEPGGPATSTPRVALGKLSPAACGRRRVRLRAAPWRQGLGDSAEHER